MENDILKHRKAVQENILKSFGVEVSEDMLEKAHNPGDIHPNGKWVWTKTPSGYDWRTIKGAGKAAPAATPTKPQPKAEEKKEDDKKSVNPLGFKVGDEAIWDEKANKVTLHTKVLIVDLNEKTDTAKIKAPKDRGTFTVSISALKLPKKKNSDGSYTLEANGKKVKSDDADVVEDNKDSNKKTDKDDKKKIDSDFIKGTKKQFEDIYNKIKGKTVNLGVHGSGVVVGMEVRSDGYTEACIRPKGESSILTAGIVSVLNDKIEDLFSGGSTGLNIDKKAIQ